MLHSALPFPSWPSQQRTRGSAIPLMPMRERGELDLGLGLALALPMLWGSRRWLWVEGAGRAAFPHLSGDLQALTSFPKCNSCAMHAALPHSTWVWFGSDDGRGLARIGADETLLAGQQVFTQRTDKTPCNLCSRHPRQVPGCSMAAWRPWVDSRETQSETPTSNGPGRDLGEASSHPLRPGADLPFKPSPTPERKLLQWRPPLIMRTSEKGLLGSASTPWNAYSGLRWSSCSSWSSWSSWASWASGELPGPPDHPWHPPATIPITNRGRLQPHNIVEESRQPSRLVSPSKARQNPCRRGSAIQDRLVGVLVLGDMSRHVKIQISAKSKLAPQKPPS